MTSSVLPLAAFREALAQFASGVTVVAARRTGERATGGARCAATGGSDLVGLTATGFTSVSLAPPLVLVCIGKAASAHDALVRATSFGVSILGERQAWIAEQCARAAIDRFRDVPLRDRRVPLIEGAVATLECSRYATYGGGDHTILIGEVADAEIGGGRPLVHCARRFGAFVAEGLPNQSVNRAPSQPGEQP